jgi:hypothetical protein
VKALTTFFKVPYPSTPMALMVKTTLNNSTTILPSRFKDKKDLPRFKGITYQVNEIWINSSILSLKPSKEIKFL